ncbi:MAG: glycerate kinase [Opitutae bacterium]|nr:glycerate kinase [Opitutae bacterium]
MRALIAFDKFKDALAAAEACRVAADALRVVQPGWQLDLCPLADGGDGFAELLTRAARGALRRAKVTGPLGAPVEATYGIVPIANLTSAARALLEIENRVRPAGPQPSEIENSPPVAVVEMAQASGLALVPPAERNPWRTTTRGTGELLLAAARENVSAILLGVGGSATHDVGLGALAALGLTAHAADGAAIANPIPETWAALARVGGALAASLPPIYIATDVTNPLMGTFGAASVFAPQKGLLEEDFTRLEYMTGRVAAMLCAHAGKHPLLCETPGCGAAGGLAFGLHCAAGAKLLPGFNLVSAWLGLEARLAAADVVITGEGSFDASSLAGKAPGEVARRALALGKKVHVFAGRVATPPEGFVAHPITPPGADLTTALHGTPANLAAAVRTVFSS